MGFDPSFFNDKQLGMIPKDQRKGMRNLVTAAEATAKAADASEKEMQETIEAFCRQKGWPCYRSRMDRKTTMPAGTPDFMICLNGRFVAIECKQPPNKCTDAQKRALNLIGANGGAWRVSTCSKDAIDFLISLSTQPNP